MTTTNSDAKNIVPGGGLKLYPSTRSTSIVKRNSVGFVQHEPVKCAVSSHADKLPSSADQLPNRLSLPNFVVPSFNKIERGAADEEQPLSLAKATVPPIGTVVPMTVNSTNKADKSTKADYGDAVYFDVGRAPDTYLQSSAIVSKQSDPCAFPVDLQNFASLLTSADEGLAHRDVDLCRLESEVSTLKEQLEVQLKVNADLKKLLVASIGDDLHHKVDALVRTKIQLANEIDDYTKKLVEDYEDLDKMSIQADIWHSKFKASRLVVDQLTADRNRLSGAFCEAQTSLQHMLLERQELMQLLVHCRRDLEALYKSTRPSGAESKFQTEGLHMLTLGRQIVQLADSVCHEILGKTPTPTVQALSVEHLSPAEQLAHKVLMRGSHISGPVASGSSLGRIQSFPLLQNCRSPFRFDGVTFNCCAHCKGEIRLV